MTIIIQWIVASLGFVFLAVGLILAVLALVTEVAFRRERRRARAGWRLPPGQPVFGVVHIPDTSGGARGAEKLCVYCGQAGCDSAAEVRPGETFYRGLDFYHERCVPRDGGKDF